MDLDRLGGLVDAAIPLLGGGYAALLGFRKIGKKPGVDATYDAWHARYGKLLRALGLLVMVYGVVLLASTLA